jgi:large subunit ribosomal protein L25
MEHHVLEAKLREQTGRSAVRQARRDGKIPGIVYGRGDEPFAVEVDAKEFERMLHHGLGEHGMLDLNVIRGRTKKKQTVLLREVQHHGVTGKILHVDFYHIDMDQKIVTSVPVVLVGHAEGVKKGGILEHVLRELELECVAKKMPEAFELDVTNLEMGHSYHVRDLQLDEEITIHTDPGRAVVTIVPPKLHEEVEAEEEAALEEEGVEPEVVGKEGEEEQTKEEEEGTQRKRREP